jgi:hypothetical protein
MTPQYAFPVDLKVGDKSPTHSATNEIKASWPKMYGPPLDCKGEFGRETSLRQCIRQ